MGVSVGEMGVCVEAVEEDVFGTVVKVSQAHKVIEIWIYLG